MLYEYHIPIIAIQVMHKFTKKNQQNVKINCYLFLLLGEGYNATTAAIIVTNMVIVIRWITLSLLLLYNSIVNVRNGAWVCVCVCIHYIYIYVCKCVRACVVTWACARGICIYIIRLCICMRKICKWMLLPSLCNFTWLPLLPRNCVWPEGRN